MGLFNFGTKKADQARGAAAEKQPGFFARMRAKLNRGDSWLTYDLATCCRACKIDDAVLDELEMRLIGADVRIETTERILDGLRRKVARKELGNLEALLSAVTPGIAHESSPPSLARSRSTLRTGPTSSWSWG